MNDQPRPIQPQLGGMSEDTADAIQVQEPPRKAAEKPAKPKKPLSSGDAAPADEYGRLDLLKPIDLADGSQAHEIVIYRPPSKVMTEVLDTPLLTTQIERFVRGCCMAINGSGDAVAFQGGELCSVDGAELASVIGAMSDEADQVVLEDTGDGVTAPIIYTLQREITMHRGADADVLRQFAFETGKISAVSEFLNARGETKEFHTFMRLFGKPLGLRVPMMTDGIINAIDWLDYLVIRRQIVPKFILSRRRWKPASTSTR